jgi:hypothetical protein
MIYTMDLVNCDGSTDSIRLAASCSVPISVLITSPYHLPWGSNIYAKVIAYNAYGDSLVSDPGSEAIILTVPDAPVSLAETVSARTASSITFTWSEGAADGGADLLDYRISYDQATGTWLELVDGITATSYTVTQLTAGQTYKFKIEARNSFGFSTYSEEVAILCATVPEVPAAPTTTNALDQVIFDWSTPVNNGLEVTSYKVLIRQSDNQYEEIIDYCNGADSQIVTDTQCTIPLSVLRANPHSLVLDDSIDVMVEAYNDYGTSGFSAVGGGALIHYVPDAPIDLTTDAENTAAT